MKHILILLLTIFLSMSVFSQIIQEQPTQVEKIQKKTKILPTYTWSHFVTGGMVVPFAWESGRRAPLPMSFRLQAGIVKRGGIYVAGTTNFRFTQPDGDYGEEENEDYKWTGKKHYNYWSIQAGPIVRVNQNLMIYWGLGFGKCIQVREAGDGRWMWSSDYQHLNGISLEANLGFMYNIKPFVISAGFSAGLADFNWYSAGKIGLGVMF